MRRRTEYRTALKYYLGDHPDQLPTDPGDDEHQPIDDNTNINLVKMTAERTVQFLFSEMPRIELDPATPDDTEEEKWLKRCFEENGGLRILAKWALRGFLAGHSFLRVKPVPKNQRQNMNKYPRLLVLDPTSVTVYWRADDVASVIWYEYRYAEDLDIVIQDFVYDEEKDNWIIYTYKAKAALAMSDAGVPTVHGAPFIHDGYLDAIEFSKAGFELTGQALHTSPIPPIVEVAHLPHPDDYYGLGEVTQNRLQDTINRIASERNRIVRENSDPVDILTGADADDVEGQGNFVTVSSPNARVNRLEMKGDLTGITTVLEKLIETYLAIARVVLLKGEAKDLQRVTNASVRTLFLDALAKNELLQSSYGFGLKRVVRLLLAMGFEAGQIKQNPANLDPTIKFGTPLPIDMTEVANINAIMVGLGARSLRTAATQIGDDWTFEAQAMKNEQKMAEERMMKQAEMTKQMRTDEHA